MNKTREKNNPLFPIAEYLPRILQAKKSRYLGTDSFLFP